MRKLTIISLFFALISSFTIAAEVNIFSARHYDSDIQLYEKFTAATGIKVNVVSGKDKALQKRITEEGADCVGDLYITADAGRLGAFAAKGMMQNAGWSKAIKDAVPAQFRSAKWTGIAKRARIIYYSPERVNANELNGMTYEGLADPKWKGRLVIRKSNNIYNQSIVASLVKNNGKANPSFHLPKDHLQNLSDNSVDFIDKSEPSIDTKLVNHLFTSNSTHFNEVNNEAFDLKTYKKFLSFLKFQEMIEKYDT